MVGDINFKLSGAIDFNEYIIISFSDVEEEGFDKISALDALMIMSLPHMRLIMSRLFLRLFKKIPSYKTDWDIYIKAQREFEQFNDSLITDMNFKEAMKYINDKELDLDIELC